MELLVTLKKRGKKVVLATSKPEYYARLILGHFGIDKYFDAICGGSMDEKRNKKDEVIAYALEESKTDAADAVMVGDRRYDIEGAKANKMISIGVLFGYGDRAELEGAGADTIAADVKELEKILLEI